MCWFIGRALKVVQLIDHLRAGNTTWEEPTKELSEENTKESTEKGNNEPTVDVPTIVFGLYSSDPEEIILNCSAMLAITLMNCTPPFDIFVKYGGVPKLVQLLNTDGYPKIQKQAALLLGCIAENETYKMHVVRSGAYPVLLQLLDANDQSVARMAAFTLNSIITGAPQQLSNSMSLIGQFAIQILKGKFSNRFLDLVSSFILDSPKSPNKPSLCAAVIETYLIEIKQLLMHKFDGFVLLGTGLLEHAFDGSPQQSSVVHRIVDLGIFGQLVEIINKSYNYNLLTLVLRLVLRVSRDLPDALIKYEALPALKRAAEFDRAISFDGVNSHDMTLTSLVSEIVHYAPEYVRNVIEDVGLSLLDTAVNEKTDGVAVSSRPPQSNNDRIIALCSEAESLHLLLDIFVQRNDYEGVLDVVGFVRMFWKHSKTFQVCDSFWRAYEQMGLPRRVQRLQEVDHNEIREIATELSVEYATMLVTRHSVV